MLNLIAALPGIVHESRCEVRHILDSLPNRKDVALHNSEYIIPSHVSGVARTMGDDTKLSKDWTNRLIFGDNMHAIEALLAHHPELEQPSLRGKIDLIYIDPPFDSGVDYRSQHTISSAITEQSAFMTQIAYSDSWKDGTVSYLRMICPRLMLMRELLSETGSIYVHIDWHVGHYVKILLDEIFGKDQFRNELVWQRDAVGKGAKKISKQWSRELESIYVYSKSEKMYFRQPHRPADQLTYTQLKEFRYIEENGRKFKIVTLGDYSLQSIEQLRLRGLIYTTSSGKQYKKYYLDEFQLAIGSLWNDIPNLSHGRNNERLHFETQKPEKLLERIIEASTPTDGLVADFFSGSGTTAAAAEKLGRKWICSDIGRSAIMTSRKRLHQICNKPFLFQKVCQSARDESIEAHSYGLEQHAKLTLQTPTIEINDNQWLHIHLQLENYSNLAAHHSISSHPELKSIIDNDPLALIEYWSVDSDYDGQLFCNQWRQHRQRSHNDKSNHRIDSNLKFTVPRKYGARIICVKAYDVFGYESEWRTTIDY